MRAPSHCQDPRASTTEHDMGRFDLEDFTDPDAQWKAGLAPPSETRRCDARIDTPCLPAECAICASLDDEWRSPQGIKNRFRIKGEVLEIHRTLALLADDGRIERLAEPTRYGVRRTRGRQQSPRQRSIEIVRYRKRG